MCNFHLDIPDVERRFGIDFARYFAAELGELRAAGGPSRTASSRSRRSGSSHRRGGGSSSATSA